MDAIGAGVGRFDHVDWRLLVVAVGCQLLGSVCHARAWANLLAGGPAGPARSAGGRCSVRTSPASPATPSLPRTRAMPRRFVLIRRAVPGTAIATIVTTLLMLTAGRHRARRRRAAGDGEHVARPGPATAERAWPADSRRARDRSRRGRAGGAPEAPGRARARAPGRRAPAAPGPIPARGRQLAGRGLAHARSQSRSSRCTPSACRPRCWTPSSSSSSRGSPA